MEAAIALMALTNLAAQLRVHVLASSSAIQTFACLWLKYVMAFQTVKMVRMRDIVRTP